MKLIKLRTLTGVLVSLNGPHRWRPSESGQVPRPIRIQEHFLHEERQRVGPINDTIILTEALGKQQMNKY